MSNDRDDDDIAQIRSLMRENAKLREALVQQVVAVDDGEARAAHKALWLHHGEVKQHGDNLYAQYVRARAEAAKLVEERNLALDAGHAAELRIVQLREELQDFEADQHAEERVAALEAVNVELRVDLNAKRRLAESRFDEITGLREELHAARNQHATYENQLRKLREELDTANRDILRHREGMTQEIGFYKGGMQALQESQIAKLREELAAERQEVELKQAALNGVRGLYAAETSEMRATLARVEALLPDWRAQDEECATHGCADEVEAALRGGA